VAPTLVEAFDVTSYPFFSVNYFLFRYKQWKKIKTSLSFSKRILHDNRLKCLKNVKDNGEIYKKDCAGDTASPSNGEWNTDQQQGMEGRRILMELSVVLSCLIKSMTCPNCGKKISLLNIEDKCCLEVNAVASRKRQANPSMDMTDDASTCNGRTFL